MIEIRTGFWFVLLAIAFSVANPIVTESMFAAEPPVKLASTFRNTDDKFQAELLGRLRIDGDTRDASGLSDLLADGSPANRFGGLSAIDYTGHGNRFWLLSDRGAGDGAVDYPCRVHLADLVVNHGVIQWELVDTKLFHWPDGVGLSGSSAVAQLDAGLTKGKHWRGFDPEGLRVNQDGNLVVTDEYGPHVVIATPEGEIIGELAVPSSFRVGASSGDLGPAGVSPNRGLESLAMTADGSTMLAVAQSPLIQDCVFNGRWYEGSHCRCLIMDQHGKVSRQVDYLLHKRSNGISEALAIDANRFLLLERDGKKGREATQKRIFLADFRDATDVRDREHLPADDGPTDFVSAVETLVIDMVDPRFGLAGDQMPEKPEGMCWGTPLPDGRRTLWVCCDNDFDPAIHSEIFCFAVSIP
jgi:hypothetical protein